jgi:hypothetical protein
MLDRRPSCQHVEVKRSESDPTARHARAPAPDLIGDGPGIHHSSEQPWRRGWIAGH